MKRLLFRILLSLAALAGVALLALAGALAWASHQLGRTWDVPLPAVAAATAPEAVARGGALFRSECAGCHAGASGRAAGRLMDDLPPFLGTFHTANLTHHPTAGVGGHSDGQLARAIRNGVLPDGRRALVMPTYPELSDADLSAILGFLRSDDPLLAAAPAPQARPVPSAAGKLIMAFVVGAAPDRSAPVVAAPLRGPTAEYGEYLADKVLHCHACHTAGFAADKLEGPGAYAGGFELRDAQGRAFLTPNITPDPETGVGRWSRPELVRALRDGIRPDGSAIGPPMPRFRELGDDELTAIAAYLGSRPAVRHAVPRPAAEAARTGGQGAALFASRGCAACHGPGAPFREKLRAAAGRPLEEVADRILHAERYAPGTQMPTFAGAISPAEARALAEHVKAEVGARAAAE